MPKEIDFDQLIKNQLKDINKMTKGLEAKLSEASVLTVIEKKVIKGGSMSKLPNGKILIEFISEKEQKAFYDKLK